MTGVLDIQHVAFTAFGQPVSYIELMGVLTGLISVYYASRANILTWPTGTLNAILLFLLFYQVQLYADMVLQVYFFVLTLCGWYTWNNKRTDIAIDTMSAKGRIITIAATLALTLAAGYYFSGIHLYLPQYFVLKAAYPYADSFIMAASIIATILLAKKKIENWYLWLLVNITSIIVYFLKEIYLLSIEYVIFMGLASYGLYNWNKQLKHG